MKFGRKPGAPVKAPLKKLSPAPAKKTEPAKKIIVADERVVSRRPVAAPAMFKSWSNTRWSDYEKCPLFAKLKHLDKLPEPKSEAMLRGAEISSKTEKYLLKQTPTMPVEIKSLAADFKFLRAQPNLIVEAQWGFDVGWNPVPWNDWNACWLRGKIDAGYVDQSKKILHIKDGKSGKYREDKAEEYMRQLDLYSAQGIAMFPQVKHVTMELLFTDAGIKYPLEGPLVYTAKEALDAQQQWTKRVRPMFNDRKFGARPGNYCRWCPYSKKAGGPCKY